VEFGSRTLGRRCSSLLDLFYFSCFSLPSVLRRFMEHWWQTDKHSEIRQKNRALRGFVMLVHSTWTKLDWTLVLSTCIPVGVLTACELEFASSSWVLFICCEWAFSFLRTLNRTTVLRRWRRRTIRTSWLLIIQRPHNAHRCLSTLSSHRSSGHQWQLPLSKNHK